MNKPMPVCSGAHASQANRKEASRAVKTGSKTGSTSARKTSHTRPTLGFGVPAGSSDPHHFKVFIPKGGSEQVKISEYTGHDEFIIYDRVTLERPRWTAIRSEVQRAFNARLKAHKLKSASWKVGDTMVDRLLGRELCVLAWAVEGMEMKNIPVAVRNWLALRPELIWWLFGMTATATGGINDGNKGWRLALRHALGDVSLDQRDLSQPRGRREIVKRDPPASLDLFGNE